VNERERIEKLEKLVDGLIGATGKLYNRVIKLELFYLANRILGCNNCHGVVIFDWEIPIIMKELHNDTAKLCPKHQKELDEFNERYA